MLAAPAEAALRFERCGPFGFQCARLSVPLDRLGRGARRVSLFVSGPRARAAARAARCSCSPAGPGQSATAAFDGDGRRPLLSRLYRRRDLIVVRPARHRPLGAAALPRARAGQPARRRHARRPRARRGSGRGAPSTRAATPSRTSRRSARELGHAADRALRHLVRHQGRARRTRSRYPANVERLVLDSVVEADGPDALYLDTFAAVPRALRALCRSGCRRFTRDPVGDVARARRPAGREAAARPARRTARGRGDAPRARRAATCSGPARPATSTPPCAPASRRRARGAATATPPRSCGCAGGPFALEGEPPPPRELSAALYAATTCEETAFPWARATPPDRCERQRQAGPSRGGMPDDGVLPVRPRHGGRQRPDHAVRPLAGGRRPRRRSAPARCPTCRCCCSRARTTCAPRWRTPGAWPPCSRARSSWWRPPPATRRSAPTPSGCTARGLRALLPRQAVPTRCRRVRRDFPAAPPPPTRSRQVPPRRGLPGPARAGARRGRAHAARRRGRRAHRTDPRPRRSRPGSRRRPARPGATGSTGGGRSRCDGLAFVPGVRLSGRVGASASGVSVARCGSGAAPGRVPRRASRYGAFGRGMGERVISAAVRRPPTPGRRGAAAGTA